MRNIIIAALAAAALVPTAAMAQPDHGRRADSRVVVVDRGPAVRPSAWHKGPVETRIIVGARIQPEHYARRYIVAEPGRYRLAHARANQRWVRIHDDAVLVNVRTGRVIAVKYRLFR